MVADTAKLKDSQFLDCLYKDIPNIGCSTADFYIYGGQHPCCPLFLLGIYLSPPTASQLLRDALHTLALAKHLRWKGIPHTPLPKSAKILHYEMYVIAHNLTQIYHLCYTSTERCFMLLSNYEKRSQKSCFSVYIQHSVFISSTTKM
jgi:hypothetical protein